ncbi:DUF5316 domain-containing protein [Psychrobacillus antarcticus]|uniref:DUF5316 domain-containing protein n=1 Tax=Psychrobacillus antarcticus TaxID=2879115 RepID=UPI0024088A2E|nr:DUF5316 domain-containing protein [Psychrobacillus antarcticus]
MKYLLFGMLLSLLGVLVAIVIWNIEMVTTITSGIGFFLIAISFIFSGVLVSGDRMRANLATESVEDRNQRNNVSFRSALMAIPSFVVAILFYFLLK